MANKEPGGNGLNLRMIIMAAVIAVISGVSSFVAIRLAMPQQIIVEKHIQEVEGEAKKEEHHEPQLGPVYPVGEFIVNLSDPGRRYLKTSVVLQMSAPEGDGKQSSKGGGGDHGGGDATDAIKGEMAPYEPLYKDAIITTLARQTVAKINAPGGRNSLKEELKAALNQRVPGKTVMDVYFTDFVIQ